MSAVSFSSFVNPPSSTKGAEISFNRRSSSHSNDFLPCTDVRWDGKRYIISVYNERGNILGFRKDDFQKIGEKHKAFLEQQRQLPQDQQIKGFNPQNIIRFNVDLKTNRLFFDNQQHSQVRFPENSCQKFILDLKNELSSFASFEFRLPKPQITPNTKPVLSSSEVTETLCRLKQDSKPKKPDRKWYQFRKKSTDRTSKEYKDKRPIRVRDMKIFFRSLQAEQIKKDQILYYQVIENVSEKSIDIISLTHPNLTKIEEKPNEGHLILACKERRDIPHWLGIDIDFKKHQITLYCSNGNAKHYPNTLLLAANLKKKYEALFETSFKLHLINENHQGNTPHCGSYVMNFAIEATKEDNDKWHEHLNITEATILEKRKSVIPQIINSASGKA